MIVQQKILLKLKEEEKRSLDYQSLLCASMYNRLLNYCKDDENYKSKYIFNSNGLRNLIVSIKNDHPYYKGCSSYPLRNVANRLKNAYLSYLKNESGYPRYFSDCKGWFSLLYDDPNKGVKIKGRGVRISVGSYIIEGRRVSRYIEAKLEVDVLKNDGIKNYRIVKEHGRYYLCICMQRGNPIKTKMTLKRVAIDPNSSNLFVAADNDGNSFLMENLSMINYFSRKIDEVKRKRDKKVKEEINYGDRKIVYCSRKYRMYDDALKSIYTKGKEQIMIALNIIAKKLVVNYDEIAIGNYVPESSMASNRVMRRAMLNKSVIGIFRSKLQFYCYKYNKKFIEVDERYTTMKCPFCGYMEKKTPDIRQYRCKGCNRVIDRDLGSAINIGIKGNVLSISDYLGKKTRNPKYTLYYDWKKNKIMKRN